MGCKLAPRSLLGKHTAGLPMPLERPRPASDRRLDPPEGRQLVAQPQPVLFEQSHAAGAATLRLERRNKAQHAWWQRMGRWECTSVWMDGWLPWEARQQRNAPAAAALLPALALPLAYVRNLEAGTPGGMSPVCTFTACMCNAPSAPLSVAVVREGRWNV